MQRGQKRSTHDRRTRTTRAANKAANRQTPRIPDPTSDAVPIAEAARRLGVSVRSAKRMCEAGQLPHFKTMGGQYRIFKADMETLLQNRRNVGQVSRHGNGGVQNAPVGPGAQVPTGTADVARDTAAALRANLEERKLKRELKKLDDEDAKDERQRSEVLRTQRRLARAREAEAELKQRQMDEEESCRKWESAWLSGASAKFPEWLSFEQEQALTAALRSTLAQFDRSSQDESISRALGRTLDRVMAPWHAEREFSRLVEKILEWWVWGFPQGTSDAEKVFVRLVARKAAEAMPNSASEWEIRAAITRAVAQPMQQIQERLQKEAALTEAAWAERSAKIRALVQKGLDDASRQNRDSKIEKLARHGEGFVTSYVRALFDDGEIDRDALEDSEWQDGLGAQIRKEIKARFTGTESESDAERVACEIVDAALQE